MGRSKKKIDTELSVYFPIYFGIDTSFLQQVREMYLYELKGLLGEEVDEKKKKINEYFININKPKIFNPYDENCVLTDSDLSFENIILLMEENGYKKTNDLNVFEFYYRLSSIEKKIINGKHK